MHLFTVPAGVPYRYLILDGGAHQHHDEQRTSTTEATFTSDELAWDDIRAYNRAHAANRIANRGKVASKRKCPTCKGRGVATYPDPDLGLDEDECRTCNGDGDVLDLLAPALGHPGVDAAPALGGSRAVLDFDAYEALVAKLTPPGHVAFNLCRGRVGGVHSIAVIPARFVRAVG